MTLINPPQPFFARPAVIAVAVILLHVGALYALQSGLLRRAIEIVVPIEMLSQLIEPPKPVIEPPPPAPSVVPKVVAQKAPTLPPPPQPLAITDPTPAPNAPTGVTTPQPPAAPIAAAVATTNTPAVAAAPPAPARIELPSSDADYLNNPPPAYPAVSKRLGEQGKVMVRVFISADGVAQKGEVRTSSGFDRLDAAALTSALRWRYVPGRRAGVPEAMWVNVPINFTLSN